MQSDSRDFTLNFGFIVVQTNVKIYVLLSDIQEPSPYEYQWK